MIADIVINTETAAAVGGILLVVNGALAFIFKMLMATKDVQLKSMEAERDSWKTMATTAVENLEAAVEKFLTDDDPKKKVLKIAAVVAEHSSPTSAAAQRLADSQTMTARLTAATLALGLPPRSATPVNRGNT
jgi:hypothetical protein